MNSAGQHATQNGTTAATAIRSPPLSSEPTLKHTRSTDEMAHQDSSLHVQGAAVNGDFVIDLLSLPAEIREMLAMLPDDVYVPVGTLVKRAAAECWSDIIGTLQELSERPYRVKGTTETPGGTSFDGIVRGDTSSENRTRKEKLWDLSQRCRHILTKLHVLMQWSSKREENKLTMALNIYLHKLRAAYSEANASLVTWITYLATRQDAAPDIDTAMQILAAGRIAGLPELGYTQPADLSDAQMLATLRQMNLLLQRRIVAEDDLPRPFESWRVHDGRVSFYVQDEFTLDLSVMSEDVDATFRFVNLSFDFRPVPSMPEDLLDEINLIVDRQLQEKGLKGAYDFLHELTLTQKLKELHTQAMTLRSGTWAGHLQVEMIQRTLVLQYWTRKPGKKSWVELTLNSGRDTAEGVPYIGLRWTRSGSLVTDHEIVLDTQRLSCESILHQVTAQHINSVLDRIFDRLKDAPLYANNTLHLEQSGSLDDALESKLSIELSKQETMDLKVDPVSGHAVLSPASDRTHRMQSDLDRSPNIADAFVERFSSLRCSIVQANLLKSLRNSPWVRLPGLKLSVEEMRQQIQHPIQRYVFFKQANWPTHWSVAATFGDQGDEWWLFYRPAVGKPAAQHLSVGPIHLQQRFTATYLDGLSKLSNDQLSLQMVQQKAEVIKMKSILPPMTQNVQTTMRVELDEEHRVSSLRKDVLISPLSSKRASPQKMLAVLAKFQVSRQSLEMLASTGLDASVSINPVEATLKLLINITTESDIITTIVGRLRYVHDLLSCIRLVNENPALEMRSLTLQSLTIDYHQCSTGNLGFEFFFDPAPGEPGIRLLPPDANPHSLIADHLNALGTSTVASSADKLDKITSLLTMTLPLLSTLQCLQRRVDSSNIPGMKQLDLSESRKSLRVHILVRDAVRFGVHIFAVDPAFQAHEQADDNSNSMLLRLEILPHERGPWGKLCWMIRPAVEAFTAYRRPSFTNESLKQRLKEKVFGKVGEILWLSCDSAAMCTTDRPDGLVLAIHDTALEWLKEALASPPAGPRDESVQQGSSQAPPQQHAVASNQMPTSLTHAQYQQQQQFRMAQQRAQAMQARAPNSNMSMAGNINARAAIMAQMQQNNSGTANPGQPPNRVMTAQPQQVRQPQQSQRRPGQTPQMRNNGHPRAVPGPQDNVINLD